MAKQKKPVRRFRTNKNQKNGNGTKGTAENSSAKEDSNENAVVENDLKYDENNELDSLISKLRAGELKSDSNLMLLFEEYQKVVAIEDETDPEENDSDPNEVLAESDEAVAENEKMNRLNEQLRQEINILKTELENMKQSQRDQSELQSLVEKHQAALVEKESLLQELDQRLQFLSHQLQDIPLISVPTENANYRITRAQMLANTILPNFYKKRLSVELNLFEGFEADEADARLIELNLMRELIHYHETELKQLLKN